MKLNLFLPFVAVLALLLFALAARLDLRHVLQRLAAEGL